MKYLALLLVFLWNTLCLSAQQPAYFILGKEQFEGVQIYGVIQDNDLNYWFASDQGFYKYDSHTFSKVECEGMKGLSAFGLVINKTGTIFCHNLNHQIIKIENGKCSVFYEIPEAERVSDISLAISEENNLIVVAKSPIIFDPGGKLIRVYGDYQGSYGFPFHTKKGGIIYHSWGRDSILEIYQNKLTIKPLNSGVKNKTGPLTFFRINDNAYGISNKSKMVYAFNEDSYQCTALAEQFFSNNQEYLRFYNVNNQVWIAGISVGVRKLEGESRNALSAQMYPDFFISSVYKDHEGNLLLSTFNRGILVIPDLQVEDVVSLPQKQSISSVHVDKEIGIVLGSSEGDLVSFNNGAFKVLSNKGRKPLLSVNSWPDFPFIIYDDGQVKAYDKKTGHVTCLFESSLKDAALYDQETVYLALNSGVRKIQYPGSAAFSSEAIESLMIRTYAIEVEAVTKNIFVATSDGLRIIKPGNVIERPLFEKGNPFANDLLAYGNRLYVATKKDGILIFENGRIVQRISPKMDQGDVEIYKLILSDNKIYANSSRGFVVLSGTGEILARLNKVQGFSANKIFDFDIRDDQIWMVHSGGFQKINVKQLTLAREKPALAISGIAVNDELLEEINKKGGFTSEQRKFKFIISSPTLRNKENIRYHYQLNGYESSWLIADYEDNELSYNALGPGEYTFRVKAENQGVFSETREYSFVISPPFYYRWWFIAGEFITFFLLVAFVYRWQLRLQRKKSERQNELNNSKLTAIQSQMNPHFIFNSLNSIQDLVLKGDIENSYSYITTFSNMVRRTLEYSDKDFIDFEQEIALLELYLSLEKLRFKKDFEYVIITGSVDDVMLPPLIIQPFIENALVHGLLHKSGLKKLKINFELHDMLICTIEDNGVGREKAGLIQQRQRAGHQSFSGKAIRNRFKILTNIFEGDFGYTYEDLYENGEAAGTKVTLRIPVKRKF
ncbi:MAG: histidine kinase [Bacteroidota bacterium]